MSEFNTDTHTVYSGEAQLLGWSETSTRGRTITLQLPEDTDTHPFRDFSIRSGKRAGQRFAVVFVQIGDDEQPVSQEIRLSQRAAILCKDQLFWSWAAERSICTIESEDDARSWLLNGAGIKSRKEFDTSRAAADWLIHMVINPFGEYMKTISNVI